MLSASCLEHLLDGIDLVEAKFVFNGTWHFEIICAETIGYSQDWYTKLKGLVDCSLETLKLIDDDYTVLLAEVIKTLFKK